MINLEDSNYTVSIIYMNGWVHKILNLSKYSDACQVSRKAECQENIRCILISDQDDNVEEWQIDPEWDHKHFIAVPGTTFYECDQTKEIGFV